DRLSGLVVTDENSRPPDELGGQYVRQGARHRVVACSQLAPPCTTLSFPPHEAGFAGTPDFVPTADLAGMVHELPPGTPCADFQHRDCTVLSSLSEVLSLMLAGAGSRRRTIMWRRKSGRRQVGVESRASRSAWDGDPGGPWGGYGPRPGPQS